MRNLLAALALLLVPTLAHAKCPSSGWPSAESCDKVDAFLMPGLVGVMYAPSTGGTWYGGGVEIAPALWSHNSDRFGPGQGKLIFDIAQLESSETDGSLLLYRAGTQLSFERNASRSLFIPFFGATFGGLHHETFDDVGFFEATAGLNLVFMENIVVSLDGGYLFPFSKVDALAGWRSTLAVNFSLW